MLRVSGRRYQQSTVGLLGWVGMLWLSINVVSLPPLVHALVEAKAEQIPVWIDTDPSCGSGFARDVDDCLALLQAFNSPELEIVGIGTVFGNTDRDTAYSTAQQVIQQLNGIRNRDRCPALVYTGAQSLDNGFVRTPATDALRHILQHRRVTILALGPLTNTATFLVNHPELRRQIVKIVAVAGRRPGQTFQPSGVIPVTLSDLNFEKDPLSFDIVLRSGIPLTLIPYELAAKVTVNQHDLDALLAGTSVSQWISQQARSWLQVWRWMLRTDGFFPFDTLAVGYLTGAQRFHCERLPAKITSTRGLLFQRQTLEVSKHFGEGPLVNYCYDITPDFKGDLIGRLIAG